MSGIFSPFFIRQHSYPDGSPMGTYTEKYPHGFTTIPNSLPN